MTLLVDYMDKAGLLHHTIQRQAAGNDKTGHTYQTFCHISHWNLLSAVLYIKYPKFQIWVQISPVYPVGSRKFYSEVLLHTSVRNDLYKKHKSKPILINENIFHGFKIIVHVWFKCPPFFPHQKGSYFSSVLQYNKAFCQITNISKLK